MTEISLNVTLNNQIHLTLHYLLMSRIILPPEFILPPYHFDLLKLLNDLQYSPMFRIILPPGWDPRGMAVVL